MPTRLARLSDLGVLVELCAEHAEYERSQVNTDGMLERLREAIFEHPPRLYCWVAEVHDEPVGYATATLDFSTWNAAAFVHLDCLYLRASVRGQGLGRMLMHEVVTFAAVMQCSNVQWQTPIWNQTAIRFYKRFRAVPYEKYRFILDVDTRVTSG